MDVGEGIAEPGAYLHRDLGREREQRGHARRRGHRPGLSDLLVGPVGLEPTTNGSRDRRS